MGEHEPLLWDIIGEFELHQAACDDDVVEADKLFMSGHELDEKDTTYKATALHLAAQRGNIDMVTWLLEKGAKVNCKSKNGSTPLHLASQQQELEVCRYLIESGANIDARDLNGLTPLHYAAQTNLAGKVLTLLIDHGVDVSLATRDGKNCMHLIASLHTTKACHLDCCDIISEQGCSPDFVDQDFFAPLHHAARNGHVELCVRLIELGATVDLKTRSTKKTPLFMAAEQECRDVIDVLMRHGADINAQDARSWTPLHVSITFGRPKSFIEYLMVKGARPEILTQYDGTTLHLTVSTGDYELALLLIHNVTKRCHPFEWIGFLDARNQNNETALHLAVKNKHLKLAELLVEWGATYDHLDINSCTPSQYATDDLKDYFENIAKFDSRGRGNEIDESILQKYPSIVNVRCRKTGDTVLFDAANRGSWDRIKRLARNRANPFLVNSQGLSVLHGSFNWYKSYEFFYLYTKYWRNGESGEKEFINLRSYFERDTALHRVSCDLLAKHYLERGACYNAKNKQGKTPMEVNPSSYVRELLELIAEYKAGTISEVDLAGLKSRLYLKNVTSEVERPVDDVLQ